MITARRMQSDFADLWIHETVQELWEPWMRHAHKALRDDNLVDLVQAELNQALREEQDARAAQLPGRGGLVDVAPQASP